MGPIRTLTVALLAASLLATFAQPARADDSNANLPARADVGPMRHLWQTLNNCGPASVVMALSVVRLRVIYSPLHYWLRRLRPIEAWLYKKLRTPLPPSRPPSRSDGTK